MFCAQCGTEIREDTAYCCKCGAKVIKNKSPQIFCTESKGYGVNIDQGKGSDNGKKKTWMEWLLAEGQRKAVAFVWTAASILIAAAIVWDCVSPGSLLNMAVPGIEVRSAYLSQYSTKVTIEEAFENFFDDCKWKKYNSGGYTYVAFTGTCLYLDEQADVRIVFKITGENFIVDSLDINGKTQSNLFLYGVLSKVYEDY